MRAVLFGLVGAVLLGGAAQAEVSVYRAKSPRLDASLTITTDPAGKSTGSYSLNAHGCIGEVSGDLAKAGPSGMILSARSGAAEICKIRFTQKGQTVVASEADDGDCSNFRGASCAFAQVLSKRR
jgi:hypothetical protein